MPQPQKQNPPVHYYNVFQHAPVLLITIDPTGNIVDINHYYLELLGKTREETIGCNVLEFVTPDTQTAGAITMQEFFSAGNVDQREFNIISKDGSVIYVTLAAVVPHFDKDKNIELATGIFEDITTPKHIEKMREKLSNQEQILIEYIEKLMLPHLTFQEICDLTTSYGKKIAEVEVCAAWYIEPQTGLLAYSSIDPSTHLSDVKISAFEVLKPNENGLYPTLAGHSLNTKQAFYTNQPDQHSSFDPDGPEEILSPSNYLAVPALVDNQVIGQISFINASEEFTSESLESAKRFSAYFSLALMRRQAEVAQSWESDINRALADMAAKLLSPENSLFEVSSVTLNACLSLTGAEHGFVGYIDQTTQDLVCITFTEMLKDGTCQIKSPEQKIAFPIGSDGNYPHLWGHALNTLEGFCTNSPDKHPSYGGVIPGGHISFESFLSVPAQIGGKLVGQIALSNCPAGFTHDHLEAIQRLANLFAVSIQKEIASLHLRQSQESYRQVFDDLPLPYQSLDANGNILDVNEQWLKTLGYTNEEVTGKWFGSFLTAEDRETFPKKFQEFKQRGHVNNVLWRMITKDEDLIYAEFDGMIALDLEGNFQRSHCIFQNITERVNTEYSLRQSEESYRTLTQNIPGLVYRSLAENNFQMVFLSQAAKELTGYTETELFKHKGWQLDHFIHPEDLPNVKKTVERAIQEKQTFNMEYRFQHKDGSTHYFQERGKPVFDHNDNIHYIDGVIFDITETKIYQQKIQELNEDLELRVQARTQELEDANKDLEAFSYSVSHDLRAPLRAIKGFSEILMEENNEALSAESQHFLERIHAASEKMNALIEDLLTLSRLDRHSPQFREIDLAEIAHQVFNSMPKEYGDRPIDFTVRPLPLAQGDPNLIETLLQNLISNAIKFSTLQDKPAIIIDYLEDNGEIVYFVKDNGIGFNMEYASKLYTPFQRLHSDDDYPGTGVGLATVKRIINHHNGNIWADSEPGKGTTFFFTLNTHTPSK